MVCASVCVGVRVAARACAFVCACVCARVGLVLEEEAVRRYEESIYENEASASALQTFVSQRAAYAAKGFFLVKRVR